MSSASAIFSEIGYRDPIDVYPLAETDPIRLEKPTFGSIELQNLLYTMNDVEAIEEIPPSRFSGCCEVQKIYVPVDAGGF